MIPVLTPDEMAIVDAAAPEPVDVLIARAGAAVSRAALDLLGGGYGRRVVVVAGKGNNGADGREAAARLERRGVRVTVIDAGGSPAALPACDLVIDAAYGTGFRGEYRPPRLPRPEVPVLAVDIPSGMSGLTGEAGGSPLAAVRTVTFAALKPGLLLGDGPGLAGDVTIADIGLDTSAARAHVVESHDVARWVPSRRREAHKWQAAVWVVAGSPGLIGAAHLTVRAAQRSGAGYVRLSSPGVDEDLLRPTEAVGTALPGKGWAGEVLADLDRFAALAMGPGLGLGDAAATAIREVASAAPVPLVVDGDGLAALGRDVAAVVGGRRAPTVLTPHDGEFVRLGGQGGDPDRLAATRDLAASTGAVVLRKGPTTVVAAPDGSVLLATTGDSRLASAGTGDVLTGTVAALLAQGVPALEAAAAAAFLHGRAGGLAWRRGLVAGDVVDHLPAALAELPEP